jgi:ribosomal protein L16 Arg81 hydroxylase
LSLDNFHVSKFEELLRPLQVDDFFANFHENKHVHLKVGEAERFSDLLSFEQLDEIVGVYGLATPDIRVVNSDKDICSSDYTWKNNLVDPVKVAAHYANGATIIFNSLQDRVEALRQFCSAVSEALRLRIQTNIYLTPKQSQGFDPHWDTHDVFVMQIQGSKRWRIYKETFELPLEQEQHKFEPDCIEVTDVIDEFILEQGDVLYIPRGVMHSAVAEDGTSLHVTLGVTPYSWQSLFIDCISQLATDDPRWRESAPLCDTGDALEQQFGERLKEFEDSVDLQKVVAGHVKMISNALRPRHGRYLAGAETQDELAESDVVAPHKHSVVDISASEDSKKITLSTGYREISLPMSSKKTIDLIFDDRKEAIGNFDDDIDWGSRKLVVETLLREGLIAKVG